jgi:hypothetical protein
MKEVKVEVLIDPETGSLRVVGGEYTLLFYTALAQLLEDAKAEEREKLTRGRDGDNEM